jgi:hypothetical protein
MKYVFLLFVTLCTNFSPLLASNDLKPLWKEKKEYFIYCRCWMIEQHCERLVSMIEESTSLLTYEKHDLVEQVEKIRYNIAWDD